MHIYMLVPVSSRLHGQWLRSSAHQFDRLFEWLAESKAECGVYFTVVHSHGVAYFTIRAKTQVTRLTPSGRLVCL